MKIAVIGGGFAGLGCALKLSKDHEVVLLEKQKSLGGVVSSIDYNGAKIPWGSHWILSTDTTLVDMVSELGLNDKLTWQNIRMGFYYKKGIYGIASPIELLTYRPLPFFDRIRFGLFGLKILLSKGKWAKELEGKSARKWLIEKANKSICENLFDPLSKIKFNSSLDDVSASWLYNRLSDTAKGGEKYGFIEGGFEPIIKSAGEKITENGSQIILDASIDSIIVEDNKVRGIEYTKNGQKERIDVDVIVSTMPIPVLLNKVSFPEEYKKSLEQVKYKYIINAFFILKDRMIKNFEWINYCYDDLPFGGTLEHDLRVYSKTDNGSVLYVFTYLNEGNEIWNKNDNEIEKIYTNKLEKMYPGIKNNIEFCKVTKSNLAWPIYDMNYASYMPGHDTPIKGLFLAGIFTTYPKMPSTGVAAESGYEAANHVKKFLEG